MTEDTIKGTGWAKIRRKIGWIDIEEHVRDMRDSQVLDLHGLDTMQSTSRAGFDKQIADRSDGMGFVEFREEPVFTMPKAEHFPDMVVRYRYAMPGEKLVERTVIGLRHPPEISRSNLYGVVMRYLRAVIVKEMRQNRNHPAWDMKPDYTLH